MSRLLTLFLCLCIALPATAATAPRIASLNLCSDQLLILLADPAQIASVSYLAADPEHSPVADRAGALALNHGQAEEILPLAPDLVLSGAFSAVQATNLLERMGLDVERLPVALSLEQVYAQIRRVADLAGQSGRGEALAQALAAQVDDHRRALRPALAGRTAVFLSPNGYSYGRNTLQHSFLDSLGMINVAAGIDGPGRLALETLLQAEPDFIIVNPQSRVDDQLAHPVLRHPALAALDSVQRITLPDAWFQCAGPQINDAYASLARQL